MKSKIIFFSLTYLLVLSLSLNAKESTNAKVTERNSTLDDQKEIAVTVYNSNIALVKDVREVQLPKGELDLKFMDVAARIKPSTVLIKSINYPDSLQILEQNYEYDLLNPQKLLDKFVGEKIKLIFKNRAALSEKEVEATLLSNNSGPIFQIDKEIRIDTPDAYVLPKIPENLISKPTLVWKLENESTKPHSLEASYLTDGINWNADYIANLNKDDSSCDLSGWVTINNQSGTVYKNAQIKLVAGDLNRVQEPQMMKMDYAFEAKASGARMAPQFKEEGLFEYHMYSLGRKTTVKDNESKQISLLNVSTIPVKKEFLYYGNSSYFRSSYGEVMQNQKIGTYVEIVNSKKNRLGMPLPKGTVRAYKADSEGNLQFIGEDSIDHTPKDEKIRIKLGDAFDIVGERKQTEFKLASPNKYQVGWHIVIKNHKDEDITVGVVEPIWGDWEVTEKNHEFQKIDAHTLRFDIKVPKNGKADLDYKVQVRWTW